MDNRSSVENQLSIALQCLHLVLDGKRAATEELQANNQELKAILDELLGLRGDLKAAVEPADSAAARPVRESARPNANAKDLDQLQHDVELLMQRGDEATRTSAELRARSKKLRTALTAALDGSANPASNGNGNSAVDGAAKAVRDGHIKPGSDGTVEPITDGAAAPNAGYDHLSKRERQVLALIVAGKSSKQIAAELGISFKTAVTHRASIMGKMDVHEIASVVREAIRRGLA